MAQLELEPRTVDTETVVVVRGEIDMATAPQLRELLNALVDSGTTAIVLDCQQLEFLDSSGIGVLVAARSRLGDGGTLTMNSPPPHVRKVLELTGVDQHLAILP